MDPARSALLSPRSKAALAGLKARDDHDDSVASEALLPLPFVRKLLVESPRVMLLRVGVVRKSLADDEDESGVRH